MNEKRDKLLKFEAELLGISDLDSFNPNQLFADGKVTAMSRLHKEVLRLHLEDVQRRYVSEEEPAKKRRVSVTKFNAPKGVEFSQVIGFHSTLPFLGYTVVVPPSKDLATHVRIRDITRSKIITVTKQMEKVRDRKLLDKAFKEINEYVAKRASGGAEPSSPKKSQATPVKLTPAAHVTDPVDVIKMRDTYFARARVDGEFVDGPHRSVRSAAEYDAASLSEQLARKLNGNVVDQLRQFVATPEFMTPSAPASGVSTPQLDRSQRNLPANIQTAPDGQFVALISVFDQSFATAPRATVREALDDRAKCEAELKRVRALISTSKAPHMNKQQNLIVQAMERFVKSLSGDNGQTLPPGVHKIRDKLYSTVEVLGQQMSTPVRSYTSEVLADMTTADAVVRELGPDADREKVVSEIKMRWASTDLMKTPRKLSLDN